MYTKSSAENYPRTSPPGADAAGQAKFGIIAALSALCIIFAGFSAEAADFEKLEKGHFVIYHQNRDLANDLIWKAEYYYKKILGHFGVAEFRPWEGKDKCQIYLYSNKADYLKATGAPDWSVGLAQMSPFRFSAYENSEKLATTTFPHELTHMIFHLFMDKKRMPLWLEEGMAQFEEEDQGSAYLRKQSIKWYIKEKKYIKLDILFAIPMIPPDMPKEAIDLFYIESASVVDHLVTDNLRTSFGKFLTCLKNGESTEQALKNSYQWKYKNGVSDLETRWLEFIKRKY